MDSCKKKTRCALKKPVIWGRPSLHEAAVLCPGQALASWFHWAEAPLLMFHSRCVTCFRSISGKIFIVPTLAVPREAVMSWSPYHPGSA
jgi:hypothetical protein